MATDKQKAFVAAYLSNGLNATQAAIKAGYSKKTARQMGTENLSKPAIRGKIDEALRKNAMGRDEVLHRIGEHARGNLGDFLTISEYGASINLEQAKELGKLGLVKKYRVDKDGNVTLELYSAQIALDMLAKAHGIYQELGSNDNGDYETYLKDMPEERDGP